MSDMQCLKDSAPAESSQVLWNRPRYALCRRNLSPAADTEVRGCGVIRLCCLLSNGTCSHLSIYTCMLHLSKLREVVRVKLLPNFCVNCVAPIAVDVTLGHALVEGSGPRVSSP